MMHLLKRPKLKINNTKCNQVYAHIGTHTLLVVVFIDTNSMENSLTLSTKAVYTHSSNMHSSTPLCISNI